MDKVVIFGAGEWGCLARAFYEKKCEIAFFVDNNEQLWNATKDGLLIYSPSVLEESRDEYIVIIANNKYSKQIHDQLVNNYGISRIIEFRIDISEIPGFYPSIVKKYDEKDEVFISFMGGLGNQMFQYAVLKYLESIGKKVSADFSWYSVPGHYYHGTMLWKAFGNLKLDFGNPEKIQEYKNKNYVYTEQSSYLGSNELIKKVAGTDKGIWQGYFQVADMVDYVEDVIRSDFNITPNSELRNFETSFVDKNTVSVHIRRTDYLDKRNENLNICTKEYYDRAMEYMKNLLRDITWVFFSDDIAWVRDNMRFSNAIYVDENEFKEYENWYDMYLMSRCNHHIIANSSYGWWGAWLDDKKNKIVVAPKTWVLDADFPDICPTSWVRL